MGVTLDYYCDFCSNLRRVLLIYKKPIIDNLFNNGLLGVTLYNKIDKIEDIKNKEVKIKEIKQDKIDKVEKK